MTPTTILLADDEQTLRDNLAQVLRDEGFHVIACRDGAEALKALRLQPIDALITDLRMPGVTGMDLIQHARSLAPEAVIIVITAFGQVDTAVNAMKQGVHDYLCKPIIFDEVIFKLKRLLAQDELEKENRQLRARINRSSESAEEERRAAARNVGELDDRAPAATGSPSSLAGFQGLAEAGIQAASSMEDAPLAAPPVTNLRSALHEFEYQHILAVLASVGGNKAMAAEKLGIGLSSLYRKLEEGGEAYREPARDASRWENKSHASE